MNQYRKSLTDEMYSAVEMGKEIPHLLQDGFSVTSMRATEISDHQLDEGRRSFLLYVLMQTLKYGKRTFIAAVRADTNFKGTLEPYRDRALAVVDALAQLTKENDLHVKDIGYILDAPEDISVWPVLPVAVYSMKPTGLRIRVIPSLGIDTDSPLLPVSVINDYGLVFTGRPENYEKWRSMGYAVELTPSEHEIRAFLSGKNVL